MSANLLNVDDFNVICRFCLLSKENMKSLTNDIYHMMEECYSEQELYPPNKFPQQICTDCLSQLKNSFNFKQQYVFSLQVLYDILLKKDQANENKPLKSELKLLDLEYNSIKNELNDSDTVISPASIKDENDCVNFDSQSVHSVELCNDNDSNHIKDEGEEKDDEFDQAKIELAKSMIELLSTSTYKLLALTCTICDRKVRTRPALLNHIKTHIKDKEYKHLCTVCKQKFYCTASLNKHMQKHDGKAEYRCEICSKDFYELRSFAIHNSTKHNTKPVQCSKCASKFLHPLQLERHEQRSHGEKEFICDVCGQKFSENSKLKIHRVKHSDERPFACTHCDKKYKQVSALNTHVKIEHTSVNEFHGQICFICGKSVKNLKVHLIAHEQTRNYKCPVCLKMYKNKYFLNNHIKDRHPSDGVVKKYYCKICNKALAERSNLAKHMACVHETEKKHGCSFCGKKYKLKSHVNKHIKSAHMNERPHVCTICKEAFFSKFILRNHMITHTGERPFACNTCGKTFGTKGVLVTHMKVHSK